MTCGHRIYLHVCGYVRGVWIHTCTHTCTSDAAPSIAGHARIKYTCTRVVVCVVCEYALCACRSFCPVRLGPSADCLSYQLWLAARVSVYLSVCVRVCLVCRACDFINVQHDSHSHDKTYPSERERKSVRARESARESARAQESPSEIMCKKECVRERPRVRESARERVQCTTKRWQLSNVWLRGTKYSQMSFRSAAQIVGDLHSWYCQTVHISNP